MLDGITTPTASRFSSPRSRTPSSVPGCFIGAKIAPYIRASYIRRGIVVVLTMSGLALLDNAGWISLVSGDSQPHPKLIAFAGVIMLFIIPLVWALLRRSVGLPMFGAPTVEQIEGAAGAE